MSCGQWLVYSVRENQHDPGEIKVEGGGWGDMSMQIKKYIITKTPYFINNLKGDVMFILYVYWMIVGLNSRKKKKKNEADGGFETYINQDYLVFNCI